MVKIDIHTHTHMAMLMSRQDKEYVIQGQNVR